MKILVTGYRGFIGQNLVHALTEQHELILFEWGDEFPDFRDLDWCIHLGAISSTAETDVEKVMRQNYDFSCKILDACQQHGVNLQYASSASVYGLNQDFRESAAKNPQSPYAWSKYLFDRCVENNVFSNIRVQGSCQRRAASIRKIVHAEPVRLENLSTRGRFASKIRPPGVFSFRKNVHAFFFLRTDGSNIVQNSIFKFEKLPNNDEHLCFFKTLLKNCST